MTETVVYNLGTKTTKEPVKGKTDNKLVLLLRDNWRTILGAILLCVGLRILMPGWFKYFIAQTLYKVLILMLFVVILTVKRWGDFFKNSVLTAGVIVFVVALVAGSLGRDQYLKNYNPLVRQGKAIPAPTHFILPLKAGVWTDTRIMPQATTSVDIIADIEQDQIEVRLGTGAPIKPKIKNKRIALDFKQGNPWYANLQIRSLKDFTVKIVRQE